MSNPTELHNGLLEALPVEIVTYLIEKVIEDEKSLSALSQTSRLLRSFALPRLRSYKVVLNISDSLNWKERPSEAYQIIQDFNCERNFRIPSYVRVLEIRDNWPDKHTKGESDLRPFVDALYTFISKCIGLRKFLRDGYEHDSLDSYRLVRRLLQLPKLKVLCLKIHQIAQWRYNETPRFEEYEIFSTFWDNRTPKGLECISLALPMDMARPGWNDIWPLCAEILISNVETLKHLWVDGPDLEKIAAVMVSGSLANLRLESLRFRMNFNPTKFRAVLGLTSLASLQHSRSDENASTNLRRIEFRDFNLGRRYESTAEMHLTASILQYMRTPNLKRFQVFGGRDPIHLGANAGAPSPQPDLEHLTAFKGLEFADFQRAVNTASLFINLDTVSQNHGKTLRTIKMDAYSFDSSLQYLLTVSTEFTFDFLKRIELTQDRTCLCPSLKTLLKIIPFRPTIQEFHITMCDPLFNQYAYLYPIVLPQRLLTPIYSTAFYLHNIRSGVRSSNFICENSELYPSTRVVTPYRSMLGESGCDTLHVNTYLSGMFYSRRLNSEVFKHPEPQRETPVDLFGDVELFHLFATASLENLELFQLEYVQKSGGDRQANIKRSEDTWRKVDGEWLHEEQITPLLPW
ncbi:hypothetical protein TWF694_003102 [Orbilia ellipsospora]|uniref:F-box domain-containing protein n=1 Tax=Orbilia ellipsospora TaxID=2528407 RepID=A0AAV9X6N0_9PEZI